MEETEDGSILNRLDDERRHLARDGEVIDVLPSVTRLRSADGSRHHIAFASVADADAGAVVEQEVDHYRRLGAGFEWKVYAHDHPPALHDLLRRHGFAIGPQEAVLVYDLSRPLDWQPAPGGGPEAREAREARVERIERPGQVTDYRRVAE